MNRSYTDYLNDMLNAASKAEQFVAGLNFDEFEKNDEKVFAVVRALEIVGEAARAVPDETQARHPEVPWRSVIGMRDKLIHGYFGVDLKRVWETVKNDLPGLRDSVAAMLTEAASEED